MTRQGNRVGTAAPWKRRVQRKRAQPVAVKGLLTRLREVGIKT